MRALSVYLGIIFLAGLTAVGADLVSGRAAESTVSGIAKGSLAVFTMLTGFATLMLKEVQNLDPKDSFSSLGLERLRRAQKIAYRRLWWMIVLGILGFLGASFAAFSEGASLEFIRKLSFVISATSFVLLLSLSIGYVPSLFFDLQRARNVMTDMTRDKDIRRKQLEALNDKDAA